MITSRLKGHLPKLGNENPDIHSGRKRGPEGWKNQEFYLQLELNLHSYFHATLAHPEDFEIFDNFDHIISILLSPFQLVKVGIWIVNTSLWSTKHSEAENNGLFKCPYIFRYEGTPTPWSSNETVLFLYDSNLWVRI